MSKLKKVKPIKLMSQAEIISHLEIVLEKYYDNPLKYFMQLSSCLFDLVANDVFGLLKYRNEFLEISEDFDKDPISTLKKLAIAIANKLNIEIPFPNAITTSSIVRKIVSYKL